MVHRTMRGQLRFYIISYHLEYHFYLLVMMKRWTWTWWRTLSITNNIIDANLESPVARPKEISVSVIISREARINSTSPKTSTKINSWNTKSPAIMETKTRRSKMNQRKTWEERWTTLMIKKLRENTIFAISRRFLKETRVANRLEFKVSKYK